VSYNFLWLLFSVCMKLLASLDLDLDVIDAT